MIALDDQHQTSAFPPTAKGIEPRNPSARCTLFISYCSIIMHANRVPGALGAYVATFRRATVHEEQQEQLPGLYRHPKTC